MNRNLIGYRNLLGLSQRVMADKLNISLNSYSQKERGQRDFTQTEMQNITKLFRDNGKSFNMEEIFLRN